MKTKHSALKRRALRLGLSAGVVAAVAAGTGAIAPSPAAACWSGLTFRNDGAFWENCQNSTVNKRLVWVRSYDYDLVGPCVTIPAMREGYLGTDKRATARVTPSVRNC